MSAEERVIELEREVSSLNAVIAELKERLKKYTCPPSKKKFYNEHKEELIQKAKEYNKANPLPKEKKQEYNRRYYEKKKATKAEQSGEAKIDLRI